MKLPVENGVITSTFEQHVQRNGNNGSYGIDIASPTLKPVEIFNIYDSEIITLGLSSTFGNRIWVKILADCLYKGLYVVYPHLSKISENLKVGQSIIEGEVVGLMGNTGLIMFKGKIVNNNNGKCPLPQGLHLHLECRKDVANGLSSVKLTEIQEFYQKK